MKKIAIVLGDSTLTGAPNHVLQLVSALKSKFEFLVICPKGPIFKQFEALKVEVKEVAMKGPFDRVSSGKIRDILTDFNPEIAHFHGARAGWLGLIAARNLKTIKKVYTEHLWTDDYHLSNPAYEEFQKRSLKFLSRYTDKIIAVSKAVKIFLEKNGYDKNKIVLIPNGVKNNYLTIDPIKKPDTAPIILGCVGSLNNIKNYRMIIKAFYLLKQEKPDLNIHLQIIGEGPLKKNLEEMVRSHKIISNSVSFSGRVENLEERYQHFTIFINCSLSESFGLAVAEAMAVGIPVVASNIPAMRELVDNGGLLVNPKDKVAIKNAILRLIEDEALRLKLAKTAKSRIKNWYSEEKMITKTLGAYNELLG